MNEFAASRNTTTETIQFRSEADFDRAVDILLAKQQPFEVIGFDAMLVPAARLKKTERILHAAGVTFSDLSTDAVSELSEPRRVRLPRERGAGTKKRLKKAS